MDRFHLANVKEGQPLSAEINLVEYIPELHSSQQLSTIFLPLRCTGSCQLYNNLCLPFLHHVTPRYLA